MANGQFRILDLNYYPHYTASGRIDGIIATTNNVTEHKYAEQALKESEARLIELNATKDKLFSIIGHVLKGPLNNIIAFSELIVADYEKYSGEEIRKFNQLIFQSAHSLSCLPDNLLTWSRSQRQNIKISSRNILIHVVAEECFNLLKQKPMHIWNTELIFSKSFSRTPALPTVEDLMGLTYGIFTVKSRQGFNVGSKLNLKTVSRPVRDGMSSLPLNIFRIKYKFKK